MSYLQATQAKTARLVQQVRKAERVDQDQKDREVQRVVQEKADPMVHLVTEVVPEALEMGDHEADLAVLDLQEEMVHQVCSAFLIIYLYLFACIFSFCCRNNFRNFRVILRYFLHLCNIILRQRRRVLSLPSPWQPGLSQFPAVQQTAKCVPWIRGSCLIEQNIISLVSFQV